MRITRKALWIVISCALFFCVAAGRATGQDGSSNSFTHPDFDNSICFQKCHSPQALSAADMPKSLWRHLIEKGGHDIFSEIPWQSEEEKKMIIQYLTNQARKPEPKSEGIGAWSSSQ